MDKKCPISLMWMGQSLKKFISLKYAIRFTDAAVRIKHIERKYENILSCGYVLCHKKI